MDKFNQLHSNFIREIINYLDFEKQNREKIKDNVIEAIEDSLKSKFYSGESFTGQELIDMLADLPDIIDSALDSELEHQRDVTTVLILGAFKKVKEFNKEITLSVHYLENEQDLLASHDFCERLLYKPQQVIEAAPPAPFVYKNKFMTRKLQEENNRMKQEIAKQLSEFSQYQRLMQMINEREAEIAEIKGKM